MTVPRWGSLLAPVAGELRAGRGRHAGEVQIALRKRDRDPRVAEGAVHRQPELAGEWQRLVVALVGPGTHEEVERALAEALEEHLRRRLSEQVLVGSDGVEQQRHDALGVGPV